MPWLGTTSVYGRCVKAVLAIHTKSSTANLLEMCVHTLTAGCYNNGSDLGKEVGALNEYHNADDCFVTMAEYKVTGRETSIYPSNFSRGVFILLRHCARKVDVFA